MLRLRRGLLRSLRTACLGLLLAAASGCGENPATGKRQLSLISEEQEIEMGRAAADETARTLGLVADADLQAYVQCLGAALAARSERPALPWRFRVVDDATPNAFALPGGYVFVTRGLLSLLDSEAELATVLGHEIAHVTARHSVSQISKAQLAQLGLGLGTLLFPDLQQFSGMANAGLSLLFLKHGRDAERQADELGFRYALGLNYDVREMADVFAALQRSGSLAGRTVLPGWLATHPAEPERIAAVEARIAALGREQQRPRVGRSDYLEQIDGLAFGENPRNGFLRDGLFIHPELRFHFRVPSGWQTENLASAVTSGSPRREALVQLTLAGNVGTAAAAERFLAQAGVRGESRTERINGIPAVLAPFSAETGQGALQGYAAFLSHRGNTYQLVTYSGAQVFPQYDTLFRDVIGSFAPLDTPLGVEPDRIDVVRLDAGTSLSDFARQVPGAVSPEQLALINQIENPAVVLPAGTLLKRIVRGQ